MVDYKNQFSISSYEYNLKKLKAKSSFVRLSEYDCNGINQVVLRHDVDFSLDSALIISEIEANLNIVSTYYILFTSDFYNPLTEKSIDLIKKIVANGHEVGLHLDCKCFEFKEKSFVKTLNLYKDIFRSEYGVKLKSFSFHNPTKFALSFSEHIYSGLVNAYSSEILSTSSYLSDSNGVWRHKKPSDLSNLEFRNLIFLTHPNWWCWEDIPKPRDKVVKLLELNLKNSLRVYDELLDSNGRVNER